MLLRKLPLRGRWPERWEETAISLPSPPPLKQSSTTISFTTDISKRSIALKNKNQKTRELEYKIVSKALFCVIILSIIKMAQLGFPGGSDCEESACNAADPGSIPGSGRSPGERSSYALQYSRLESSMDRGA